MIFLIGLTALSILFVLWLLYKLKSYRDGTISCFFILLCCFMAFAYSVTFLGLPKPVSWFLEPIGDFQILAVSVREPDNSSNGAIYYWIRQIPMDPDRTPLNIKLPYSPEAHKQAQEVQKRLQKGQGVQGRKLQRFPGDGIGEEGDGSSKKPGSGGEGNAENSDINPGDSGEKAWGDKGKPIPNYHFELVEPESSIPPKLQDNPNYDPNSQKPETNRTL